MKPRIEGPSAREDVQHEKPLALVILVVEDCSMIRELACRMLSELGHSCIEANCAEHAMRILEQESADLVITDYSMGEMTGLELIEYIKQTHPATPAILASGYDTSLSHPDVFNLFKPYFLEDLEKAIQEAVPPYNRDG